MSKPLTLKRLFLLAAVSSLGMVNTGCEDQSQANLASAQTCLDAASTTDQANACAARVANDYSADAYLIRCSANFIAQGVTGNRLANAYKQMDSDSGSSNKTTALMAYLMFNDSLTGNSAAETVFNCQSSGVNSMYQLASAASLATGIGNAASTALGVPLSSLLPDANGNVDSTALQSALQNLNQLDPNVPADAAKLAQAETTIGGAVSNSYSAFCGSGGTFSSQDVCSKVGDAVNGGGTSQNIGSILLGLLQPNQ